MRLFSIESLSVFALISPVLVSSNAPPQAPPPQHRTVLHPINIANYEASMGLQRRDSNDLSTLDPQNQSELIYGSPGDNGHLLLLANMTLYAPDGLPIVLLERFEQQLNVAVKCQDDEGILSLIFASEDAFDYAVKQWGYVNEADDGRFLLIANEDGCGVDGQRQPYIVSNITEDDVTLTTSLAARMAPWSEVAGSYELNFGHAISIHQPKHLRDRGWWDDVENAGNDTENAAEAALDTAKGNFNKSQSASFPISAGQPNQRTTIFTDSRDGVTIDCTNCFVNGSLEVTGYVLVQNFKLQDLILTTSPNSLFAALELEAIIAADDGPDSLGHIWNLPNIPIPDLGISITDIMNIGVTPTYSVGVNGSFGGSATVDFGLQFPVPNSAQIVANYNNQGASTATGFSGGQPIPNFNIINESAFVTLSAFSQLGITLGVDLFTFGGVDVALTVKLPEVSATFTAKHDENGACSDEAGASKTGIELDSTINIEIDLSMSAKVGDKGTSWLQTLFTDSMPLYNNCYPLNIPGLMPLPNVTTVSTLPSTTPVSALLSGVSAFPNPSLGLERRWAIAPFALSSAPPSYPSRSYPQTNSSSTGGRLSSGALSGLGTTLMATASPTPPSAKPTSTLPPNDSSFMFSILGAILGLRPSSSVDSLPTSTVPVVSTLTTANPPGNSDTLSSLGMMTTIPTFSTSLTASRAGSSSTLLSSTSSSSKTTSMSTLAALSTSSKVGASSILSPPTSKGSSTTLLLTLATSSMSSETESSSIQGSTTSSSIETTSATTLASSKVQLSSILSSPALKSSSLVSSLAKASVSSRSESSSTFRSSILSGAKTTSMSTRATSPKFSSMESSTSLSSTTHSLSAHEPSHSTEIDTTSVHSSRIEPSSTLPSATPTISAHEPSRSTEVDAATKGPETPSTKPTPSTSASTEYSHTPAPILKPASSSALPDLGVKTSIEQPDVTSTPVEPSPRNQQFCLHRSQTSPQSLSPTKKQANHHPNTESQGYLQAEAPSEPLVEELNIRSGGLPVMTTTADSKDGE